MEKRLVFTGQDQILLESFTPPELRPGELRLRTLVTLISSGTECIVLHRRFDAGTHWDNWVKYPFYPGYAAVCEVIACGPETSRFQVGDRVVCRAGHASVQTQPEANCFPAPKELDPRQAAWFALAKIASMALTGTGNLFGRNVAILGAGPIGQMAARWVGAAGAGRLFVVDPVAGRLELIRRGVDAETLALKSSDAPEEIARRIGDPGIDVVIDTTGNAAVFSDALRLVRRFGRVVILGDTGSPARQHLSSDVMTKGIRITATHDGHEAPEWNSAKAIDIWFRFIADGRIRLDGLNTHNFQPEAYDNAYAAASDPGAGAMGITFDWRNQQ